MRNTFKEFSPDLADMRHIEADILAIPYHNQNRFERHLSVVKLFVKLFVRMYVTRTLYPLVNNDII